MSPKHAPEPREETPGPEGLAVVAKVVAKPYRPFVVACAALGVLVSAVLWVQSRADAAVDERAAKVFDERIAPHAAHVQHLDERMKAVDEKLDGIATDSKANAKALEDIRVDIGDLTGSVRTLTDHRR